MPRKYFTKTIIQVHANCHLKEQARVPGEIAGRGVWSKEMKIRAVERWGGEATAAEMNNFFLNTLQMKPPKRVLQLIPRWKAALATPAAAQ